MKYWLMKSEPSIFSIDDLARVKSSLWDGVRNYQARNFMTQQMEVGHEILFYHSNAEPPGVAGRARVAAQAQPDPTQFDRKSPFFDPKARPEEPIWFAVKVAFVEKFKHLVSLEQLRTSAALKDMLVLKKGQRLSVQPVTAKEYKCICAMNS